MIAKNIFWDKIMKNPFFTTLKSMYALRISIFKEIHPTIFEKKNTQLFFDTMFKTVK